MDQRIQGQRLDRGAAACHRCGVVPESVGQQQYQDFVSYDGHIPEKFLYSLRYTVSRSPVYRHEPNAGAVMSEDKECRSPVAFKKLPIRHLIR